MTVGGQGRHLLPKSPKSFHVAFAAASGRLWASGRTTLAQVIVKPIRPIVRSAFCEQKIAHAGAIFKEHNNNINAMQMHKERSKLFVNITLEQQVRDPHRRACPHQPRTRHPFLLPPAASPLRTHMQTA